MFTEQQFLIPKLHGLSEKTIDEHKKLYAGYVKNANLIIEHIDLCMKDIEKRSYELGELYRRLAFEFNGIRNHECYFRLLEGTAPFNTESALAHAIREQWGDMAVWKDSFINLALTRGIGWAMTSWDPVSKKLILHWVDEQHLGQLQGTTAIIALDMWEHSYVADYFPSGKKQYVLDFMSQINWIAAEANFAAAVHTS